MKFRLLAASSVLLILAIAAYAFAQASAPGGPPPPTQLAVVNLVSLFDGLLEKADADREMEAKKAELDKEGQKMGDELQKMTNDVNHPVFKTDSPEFLQLQRDVLKRANDLRSYQAYSNQFLLMEQTARTKALYKKINDAIASYAQANGIALVFVADDFNVDKAPDPQALTAMVSVRKILYVHPRYDITANIKQAMNTAYQLAPKK